ncbi:site-2 protease family protein [Merismopedia glauca CCAP 1448/3]|uniref:Site-2 protease family protein n=1 Tax=Merismopedia glauca CCAP 1448/3 TaxID=1296344 RepID=A0A2T1BYP4_9CYAN|nr:site-2 protease family protein [Merismopedia glauca CCAP 1448/3]
MSLLVLIILVGAFTYVILKRRVAYITKTPVWLLWLVLMMPILVSLGLSVTYGDRLPSLAIVGVFFGSWILYLVLLQWGRKQPSVATSQVLGENSTTGEVVATATPELSKLRPIDTTEESNLRNCFPWSVYYLEKIEYLPQAVLCRGKLRSNPEQAYETITDNIKKLFGDRFFIIFQESFSGKPFFALVPNPQAQQAQGGKRELFKEIQLSIILLLLTLFTTTWSGIEINGIADKIQSKPELIAQGFLYSLPLLLILGIHELGHYFSAKFYQMKVTLPLFFPVPFFLGTFGAFIQMRSPAPNRKALFDVSIAGPLAGLAITLPVIWFGLQQSLAIPLSEKSGILNFDSFNPRFSLLVTLLSKFCLGSQLTSQMAIDLHPIAVAGYIGILVTALNLMPVGQLDGGHIVHAMFGQKAAAGIGQIARILMLLLGFAQQELLLWALLLLFMPISDEPALNDVSELDNRRDFLGLISLIILASILIPVPEALRAWLNV